VPKARAFTGKNGEDRRVAEGGCVCRQIAIHAGGRGKAGCIRSSKLPRSVEATRELIGKVLVTHQNRSAGKEVRKVLIERAACRNANYLSILIDARSPRPSFLASTEGGWTSRLSMQRHPEKILRSLLIPRLACSLSGAQDRLRTRPCGAHLQPTVKLILGLYRAFWETDASLIENQYRLIVDQQTGVCLDAKNEFSTIILSAMRHPRHA